MTTRSVILTQDSQTDGQTDSTDCAKYSITR